MTREYVEVFGLAGSETRLPVGSAATTSPARPTSGSTRSAFRRQTAPGSTTDFFGVALNNRPCLGRDVGVTGTFITIGSFETDAEAQACLKYIKSKFARAMLGVLKVTQDNPRTHLEVRPPPGLHARLGHRLDKVDPRDRRAAVRQVRPRPRGDRLHRGQGQADGMTAGVATPRQAGDRRPSPARVD